jgi:hypothetical protein
MSDTRLDPEAIKAQLDYEISPPDDEALAWRTKSGIAFDIARAIAEAPEPDKCSICSSGAPGAADHLSPCEESREHKWWRACRALFEEKP